MKKLLFTLLLMASCFTMSSCVTTVEAQDDMYSTATVIDVSDIDLAITYGTPYIIDGLVYYYLYNNLYYYPFYSRGYWYYRVYSRPLVSYPRYWKPVPRSHWFRDGRFHNPHRFVGHGNRKPGHDGHGVRPGVHRRSVGPERPSSTRTTVHGRTGGQNRVGTSPGSRSIGTRSGSAGSPSGVFRGSSRPSSPSVSRGGGSPRPSSGGGHFGGRR